MRCGQETCHTIPWMITGERLNPTRKARTLANSTQIVFDGHNDTLLSLRETGRSFFEESDEGHIDLPRANKGGLGGGFFAIWIPDPSAEARDPNSGDPTKGAYSDPASMPANHDLAYCEHYALESLASAAKIERESDGQVRICRTTADIRSCIENGIFAIELHIEGAEPIDPSLSTLEAF